MFMQSFLCKHTAAMQYEGSQSQACEISGTDFQPGNKGEP